MQTSPNRERTMRICGCRCRACSPYIRRGRGDRIVKAYRNRGAVRTAGYRDRSKPKGQHAYRKGLA